jgi:hypothetical protein
MVKKKDQSRDAELLREITAAEEGRALALSGDATFTEWVQAFRKDIVEKGFLMPLYAWDGRNSRSMARILKLGGFVQPEEMMGQIFTDDAKDRVVNELMWFQEYLMCGPEAVWRRASPMPEEARVDVLPAVRGWESIVEVTEKLGMFGEMGGGVFSCPEELDSGYLAGPVERVEHAEGGGGYLEAHNLPAEPRWMMLSKDYRDIGIHPPETEARPVWFHIAEHAFFNRAIKRLPVCCAVYTDAGKVGWIRLLCEGMSPEAGELVVTHLSSLPPVVSRLTEEAASNKEWRNAAWWLWHNVGHPGDNKPLGYGAIADLGGYSRSTVQGAIKTFDARLSSGLEGHLLGRLLVVGERIGLGRGMVHQQLVERGLLHPRKPIDGFDTLDGLSQA